LFWISNKIPIYKTITCPDTVLLDIFYYIKGSSIRARWFDEQKQGWYKYITVRITIIKSYLIEPNDAPKTIKHKLFNHFEKLLADTTSCNPLLFLLMVLFYFWFNLFIFVCLCLQIFMYGCLHTDIHMGVCMQIFIHLFFSFMYSNVFSFC